MYIFYTDKVGDTLYLDNVTGLEYSVSSIDTKQYNNQNYFDYYPYVWESMNAGEVLIRSLGYINNIIFLKRR